MLFHAYLAVDWSASSVPKTGKDSVWLCLHGSPPENHPTREAATERVRALLREDRRILVGFDFPYGYPAGFGDVVAPGTGPAWRRVWNLLAALIEDDGLNRNNRFAVAAALNRGSGPFWGCPAAAQCPTLTQRRTIGFPYLGLAEYRATERGPRVQSAWKLGGVGSVGSQALLGIPRLASLRDDPELASASAVWPFESVDGARVVHAEIWPGLVPPEPGHAVRDAAQVAAVVRRWAELDRAGRLGTLFRAAPVAREEGWILGAAG